MYSVFLVRCPLEVMYVLHFYFCFLFIFVVLNQIEGIEIVGRFGTSADFDVRKRVDVFFFRDRDLDR